MPPAQDVQTPVTCGSSVQLGFTPKSVQGEVTVPLCTGITVKVTLSRYCLRRPKTSWLLVRLRAWVCLRVNRCTVCLCKSCAWQWMAWMTGSITLTGKHRQQQNWCRYSKNSNLCFRIRCDGLRGGAGLQLPGLFLQINNLIPVFLPAAMYYWSRPKHTSLCKSLWKHSVMQHLGASSNSCYSTCTSCLTVTMKCLARGWFNLLF